MSDPRAEAFARLLAAWDRLDLRAYKAAAQELRAAGFSVCPTSKAESAAGVRL